MLSPARRTEAPALAAEEEARVVAACSAEPGLALGHRGLDPGSEGHQRRRHVDAHLRPLWPYHTAQRTLDGCEHHLSGPRERRM